MGGQLGRCRPEVVSSAEQEVGAREQGRPDGSQGTLAVRAAQAVLVPPTTHCAQQPALLDRPTTPSSFLNRTGLEIKISVSISVSVSVSSVETKRLDSVWSQSFGLKSSVSVMVSVVCCRSCSWTCRIAAPYKFHVD